MKKSFFCSLPPAGERVPLSSIYKVMRNAKNGTDSPWIENVKEYLSARHALFVASGRTALWMILKALSEINPKKKEVVIPAYTCPALASAIFMAGLQPVLSDINLKNFGYCEEDLNGRVTNDTLAIIVVHLFGYPADMKPVFDLKKRYDILVIEDAAQAFGNTLSGAPDQKLGLLGDAGFFSFGRGKPMGVLHGGLFVTQSENIYERVHKIYQKVADSKMPEALKYILYLTSYSLFSNPYLYGVSQRLSFLHLGETIYEPNFGVSRGLGTAASLLNDLLQSVEKQKTIREKNVRWYTENLNQISKESNSRPIYPYVRYPFIVEERKRRDVLLEKLASQATGAALFYPCPLNELAKLGEILNDKNDYANSKKLSETLITLPVHVGVTEANRNKIRAIVDSVLSN